MRVDWVLRIGTADAEWDGGEPIVPLEIVDVLGSYTIPYIQSDRTLELELADGCSHTLHLELTLVGPDGGRRATALHVANRRVRFTDLAPGEYSLEARLHGREAVAGRVGIGTVIAALGDSITEGYHGQAFNRKDLRLRAADFPFDSVSADGRNFPTFAPTAHRHKPAVNTMTSWMARLNDLLTDAWRQPVFIANEGWGAYTTADYLRLMREDDGWQARMRQLRPQLWLIHLGVNDERAKRPTADLLRDLDGIVDTLIADYGAASRRIVVALPCYDYHPDAPPILAGYVEALRDWIARRGLGPGPDFHTAYATDRPRWYGADPVHPNEAGMDRMAALWAEALTAHPGLAVDAPSPPAPDMESAGAPD